MRNIHHGDTENTEILFFYPIYLRDLCVSVVNLFFIFLVLILFPSISYATEEDSLKDMDLEFLAEETSVEEKAKFFSISGYLESRNQLRIKDVDEPISLRQRLWLDCYLGQDWIRGFASARADARLPILLADGIFLLGPVTFEGVLIPKAEVNEFPLSEFRQGTTFCLPFSHHL